MSQQYAHAHMQVAEKFTHHAHSDLPSFTVLRHLANTNTPTEAVDEVLKHKDITEREVKEIIDAHREDRPPPEIVTGYQKAMLLLNRVPESEAEKACTTWLARRTGSSSTVVSKDKVRTAFRKISQVAHPDKGGSAEMMSLINAAKTELLE